MSATDELCEMLADRCEEFFVNDFGVNWRYYSDPHTATESMDGTLIVTGLTPAQAIAATLGTVDAIFSERDQLKAENAKLVDVLHEVETEAVYAYHCLQQDCMTTADSSEHFFKKWWHAECELDRLKAENAILRDELEMVGTAAYLYGRDDLKAENAKLRELVDYMTPIALYSASERERDELRELGIEVEG